MAHVPHHTLARTIHTADTDIGGFTGMRASEKKKLATRNLVQLVDGAWDASRHLVCVTFLAMFLLGSVSLTPLFAVTGSEWCVRPIQGQLSVSYRPMANYGPPSSSAGLFSPPPYLQGHNEQ